jgi:mono/diheme cytochrome c family protein
LEVDMKPVLTGVCLLAAVGLGTAAEAADPAEIARGKYVFAATGGCGCHTEPGKNRVLNAGARKFEGPFGTVYSSNITSDRQTGLGGWSDDQIITAVRLGRRPNGERILPVHPFTVFNGMSADDLRALVAYLRTLPPVSRKTPAKQITVPLFESVFLPAWLAAFAPRETPPATAPTTGVARGEYLVKAVGHCGECHTPRTMTMATDNSRFLGGNPKGPENSSVPNITPDKATGLTWTEDEIVEYLATGNRPDGDVASGLMAEMIEGTTAGYKDVARDDLRWIARYLRTIPPVSNKVSK